jgi:hypothetical protein
MLIYNGFKKGSYTFDSNYCQGEDEGNQEEYEKREDMTEVI